MNLKHFLILIIVTFFLGNVYAQNELNPYKYIIVPKQYDFLKKENQYRVNSYTRHLFAEEGFEVFYNDADFPEDLVADPCLALRANVLDKSSSFTTKLYLVLENCAGKEVFRCQEGRSKIKEFDKTYLDALKKSFVSIQELNYSYQPNTFNTSSQPKESTSTNQVETSVIGTAALSTEKSDEQEEQVVQEEAVTKELKGEEKSMSGTTTKAPVVVIPVMTKDTTAEDKSPVEAENKAVTEESPETEPVMSGNVARAFQNENVSFLLVDQGAQLQAYVSQSKNKNYKPGELIGTFKKSSLPNVFKVSWKKPMDGIEETTAYFDEQGNLKIDVYQNGTLNTLTFSEIK